MRPLKLVTRALGPYTGEQVLDFRHLRDRTLFLIHGPTGSGKTTILDAVTFALYGECSSGERDVKRIRSDHADPSLPTEVTFDFRLGGDEYRVFRRPEQQRPKKRGEGTTLTRAKAVLSRRTGGPDDSEDGTVLETQWTRVTEAVEKLLGFRSDQFRQVVILPQGQFRRLLLADSRERQAILEVLFQTEVYRRIEEALKQASKEVETHIKDARQRLRFILDQAEAESMEELMRQEESARSKLADARNKLEGLKFREKNAHEQLSQARRVEDKLTELKRSQADLHAIEKEIEGYDRKRSVLAMAHKATALLADEKALDSRQREAELAAEKLHAARKDLEGAQSEKERAKEALVRETNREEEREHARGDANRLDALTERVRELAEAMKRFTLAEKHMTERTGEFNAATKRLEGCIGRIDENQAARLKVEKIAEQRELLELRAQEAEEAFQERSRLNQLNEEQSILGRELQRVSASLEKAEQSAVKAASELELLETAWIEGQAAILAEKLESGTPCPVCGSLDHPNPARTEKALPNESALKRKRARVDETKDAVDRTRAERADVEKRISEIRVREVMLAESLAGLATKDVRELDAEVKRIKKELKQSVEAGGRAIALKEEAAQLEEALAQAKAHVDRCKELKDRAVSEHQAAVAEVAARQSGMPEGLRDISALNKAKQKAQTRMKALDEALAKAQEEASRAREGCASCEAALKAAEDAAAETTRRLLAQREDFAGSLSRSGFPDETAFKAAKRTAAELEQMETEIRNFENALNAARDRVKRATEGAKGLERPDMDSLEKNARQAKQELEAALREEAALTEQIKRVERFLKDYRTSSQERKALEAEYAVIGRISEVANGQNQQGITFQRFVLAALLDDVLIAASDRLQIMSNRRYTLQRRRDRGDRRSAAGLDLEVMDAYTGIARPVSTLSGGEGFLASLSLALGLSDVVQAYAGGIHLDTIFVDEGFGSLDPEALDLAFRALVDLQQGGRLVGIISHVPDLRERIDTRLEVTSDRRGSRAQFVVG